MTSWWRLCYLLDFSIWIPFYLSRVTSEDLTADIFPKPAGIIALLDEVRMFPRSTHETFAESYIRPLKIISGSTSQSCLGLLLLFATMLVMDYVVP
ncbi:hypothetical protein P3S67_007437 [Capsicum chacoense]